MPKYGIHHIVLLDAIHELKINQKATARDAGYLLTHHSDIANLGAIGPDIFFWAPDYDIVKPLNILYDNIKTIVDLSDTIERVINDLYQAGVRPVEQPVRDMTPHTFALIEYTIGVVKETAERFKETINTALFADVGNLSGLRFPEDIADLPAASALLFKSFTPPLQYNEPVVDWYWFDMLHYRNTGDFARQLVTDANTDRQRAYAYGYLSHIATDLLGHGFVNQIVGGPYRLHVQRHVTVENFMDCWKFWQYYGTNINLTLFDRLGLPEPPLPTEIRDLLHKSFHATYDYVAHPTRLAGDGFLSPDEISQTYKLFYGILEMMERMSVPPPEEPFKGVLGVLSTALGDLLEAAPSPPSSPVPSGCSFEDVFSFGTTHRSRECWGAFFREASKWLKWVGELLEWAFETLVDLADLLLALFTALPVIVVLSILYGIQLLLYKIYRSSRSVLALLGFVYPEPEDLNTSHGRNLTTTYQCCCVPFDEYPRWTDLNVSHLVCPPKVLEFPETAADFQQSSQSVTPDIFIRNRNQRFDRAALQSYAQSQSPQDTRGLQQRQMSIGNATELTAWMIATAAEPIISASELNLLFTNWNLDADRGYGYKTWTGTIPRSGGQSIPDEAWV